MASKKPTPHHPKKPVDLLDLDRLKGRLFSIKFGAAEQDLIPFNYTNRIDALQDLRFQFYQKNILANRRTKTTQGQSTLFGIIWMGIILGWARSQGKINHKVFLRLMDKLITRTKDLDTQF